MAPLQAFPDEDLADPATAHGDALVGEIGDQPIQGRKTGCRYERAQLRTAPRLLALLAFLALVAIRLLQVRDEARERPLTPAVEIVPVLLVQLVALHFGLEAAGMTIHTFWRCVAKVGGFLGRKGDGDPGWQTLWQGWSEVLQWYRGALLMKALSRCG